VTFTTTGIVDIGDDGLHLFSDPGQTASLSGMPFSLSISIDPDFLEPTTTTDYATVLRQWNSGASYHGSMTLNGRTFSWVSQPDARATLEMYRHRPWVSGLNEMVQIDTIGSDGGTRTIGAANRVASGEVPFMGSVDPMREHSFPVHMDGLYTLALLSVRDSAATGETFIRANELTSAIWQVSPVPEPSQYLMFGAGLAAFAALRYRRRRGARPLALASVLLGLSLANPAAAQTLTFTTSGVIEDGSDALSLFGAQPQSLAGQAYTMSLSMDAAWLDQASWSVNHAYLENWERSAKISGELTVGGKVYTWESALADAQAGMSIPHPEFGDDAYAVTMSTWSGELAQTRIYATSLLTSTTQAFVGDVELLADASFTASLPLITSQSYFQASHLDALSGATSLTWMRAAPVATAVWGVSSVPEPAQAGMLAAGLGLLVLARGRSGRRSAGCGCGQPAAARR
jgi:hypothetical protein